MELPMTNANLPPIPDCWRNLITDLCRRLEKLSKRQDIPLEALRDVVSITCEARKLQAQAQSVLPGFEVVAGGRKPFIRPTIEEVQLFCQKAGVCGQDANWFWYKMEGQEWKVNDKKVSSWQHTITAWKLAGYLPSMKGQVNGNGYKPTNGHTIDDRSLARKEMDRLTAEIQRDVARETQPAQRRL